MNTQTTHPYPTPKAREVFAGAGGDPHAWAPLARWAQQTKASAAAARAVAADGSLAAQIYRHASATYVSADDAATRHLDAAEVALALGVLRRSLGQDVARARACQVICGAARRVEAA